MYGKLKRPAFSDVVLIVSGLFIIFLIPELASRSTGCLFNKTTGFYCAGCGISRGVHALLRCDISRALHYNFLLVTVFPLSGIWLTLRYFRLKRSDEIKKYDKYVILFFIFAVLSFMLLRNLPSADFNFIKPV
jgi:hypothetical protein